MNTRILSILFVGFFLGACSGAPINTALSNCPKQSWSPCKGNANAPTANIITNGAKLKVEPYCMKAVPGSELWFRVVPKDSQPLGTVEIIPKDPVSSHDDWLQGTNSTNQNLITITVPGPDELKKGDKYYFGVKINGKCVDPRVHIEN